MNGYSKMKIIGDTKSRSIDFSSDLFPSSPSLSETRNPKPEIPESNLEELIKSNPLTKTNNTTSNRNKTQDSFSFSEQEEEEEEDQVCNINYNNNNNDGEKFGSHIKLRRNSTVSASSAASHALQYTVKRAFSMRRSSSVSERYSRIHDQSVTVTSPFEDEDLAEKKKRKKKTKISKSKIIKACKKLFGL
ncbi:hypothetical protein KPL70_013814 [Citrus sinensis]|uniref:Uncharacterized protein n=2 Tax=Citrus TaxID=2706 RepID=V4T5P2_CITCL|nr:hypothetical protein CICLE_v10002589mg [Citrus x clementina]KAH9685078.1 hypothetical protein KPL70_013814 [Citrus sinensis]GAY62075.1 hypothetical protein CUMW_214980 [Citrus unshiu]